ncbi:MAG: hypothetical protein Q8P00_01580 [Dehalococcoidia bacterium]|nr:hypothetical protein [Dehalococcoidia bacterium]
MNLKPLMAQNQIWRYVEVIKIRGRSVDIFIGLGLSFILLSLVIAALFFTLPLPEGNTYVGGLLGLLLALFFIGGAVLFIIGILIDRGQKRGKDTPKGQS